MHYVRAIKTLCVASPPGSHVTASCPSLLTAGSEKRMDSLGDSQLLGYGDVAHRFSGGVHNENDDKCAVQAKMRVNVGSLTEPKTTKSASLPSKLDAERILMGQTALQASLGPRTFPSYSAKRTAREVFPESDIHMPKFRRGFLWSSSPQNHISPAALYTETAPPLPSPPAHLLNEPVVQASLRAMKDHIKVETPFNVECFENLLVDHLNQHFVRSVMTGLWEGFWPFHDGEYKVELQVKGRTSPLTRPISPLSEPTVHLQQKVVGHIATFSSNPVYNQFELPRAKLKSR
ncbi:hypothetical protein B0H10DRAFT_1957404 [Mycena sp. CBHHK59/15]|nr:hypothetical protein B0H10DRAFT_1957404 [Mycena sp. CBHHK59/15]